MKPDEPAQTRRVRASRLGPVVRSDGEPTGPAHRRRRWHLEIGGFEHEIELGPEAFWTGAPRRFFVDGAAYSLGPLLHIGPRSAAFTVGGQAATLTMRSEWPGVLERYRRYYGRGVAGWLHYDLMVDGREQGAWVMRMPGSQWRFVAPGAPVPDASMTDWPESSQGSP